MIIMTMIMIIGNDYYLIMIIVVMCIYIHMYTHIYIFLLGLPYALRPCTHVETRNRICIWVIWGGVGVGLGWGGGNNLHVNLNTHGLYGVRMGGVGWG